MRGTSLDGLHHLRDRHLAGLIKKQMYVVSNGIRSNKRPVTFVENSTDVAMEIVPPMVVDPGTSILGRENEMKQNVAE